MSRRLASARSRRRLSLAALTAAGLYCGVVTTAALAQAPAPPVPAPTLAPTLAADDPNKQTLMEADEVSYDKDRDVVVATGRVEIEQGGQILLADRVEYDRKTDTAMATGHVALIEPGGT